jgi:hypothetical protein
MFPAAGAALGQLHPVTGASFRKKQNYLICANILNKGKGTGKVKVHPVTGHEGPEGEG